MSTNSGDTSVFVHSHTVSGENRLLVVGVTIDGNQTVDSVLYSGQLLIQVSALTHSNGSLRVEVWELTNPPAGTSDIEVQITDMATAKAAIGAISYTGVDQTLAIDHQISAKATSAAIMNTISSESDDLVQDVVASVATGASDAAATQTSLWNIEMGGAGASDHWGAASSEPGAASVIMSWTLQEAASDWVSIGFNINAAVIPEGSNQLPLLAAIGAQSTSENVNLNFGISATYVESTPILTTSILPTGATFVDDSDSTEDFDWTPTYLQSGVYDITFYATDDSSAVDSEFVSITVNNVDRPPVLAAIGSKSVGEGQNLNFSVSSSDPDGSTPTLTAEDLPTNATFADNGDGTGTFDFDLSEA